MKIVSHIWNNYIAQNPISRDVVKALGKAVSLVTQNRQEPTLPAQPVKPASPSVPLDNDSHHEYKETRKIKNKFELIISMMPKIAISRSSETVIEEYNKTNSKGEDEKGKEIDTEA